ncbi:Tropinesterase [bacterium HR40]|nr:Tropinesterase [bacterium HR40]
MRRRSAAIDDEGRNLRLSFVEWGDPQGPPVVCVHGLTRNARDFDALAAALATRGARVLCIDVAGRGESDWLTDPMRYTVAVYARQLAALLDTLGLAAVDWVGTSMGGLIALDIARRTPGRLRRLVLNDIGPFVSREALVPIRGYLGLDLAFANLDQAEAHLRTIHAGFGPLADRIWRHLAAHSVRFDGDRLRLHYDPRIRDPFLATADTGIDMWEAWQRLACSVLVLRGAESAILDTTTLQRMTRSGPPVRIVEFPGVGHAPALFDPAQIEVVVEFLAPVPAAPGSA